MKKILFQYAELLLSIVVVGMVVLIAFRLAPVAHPDFRRWAIVIVLLTAISQSLLVWSIWSRRKRLKLQIIAAARHTIRVQAENTLYTEDVIRKGPEFANASQEQMDWYCRGYAKGIKDYEFTLDQLIEPIIRATKEFYAPPGMDSAA
jgi:hypothetical protein